jgi:two-component system, chemotaxis family, chemotaxis protein CheY
LVDYVDPVLVVDDLNTMTRIVDGMLRKCGFTNVEQVHDGQTALQKLREKSFLFVVTDREMPGMNGLELVREIRADPKIRNVPLVIMSASSEGTARRSCNCGRREFFHDQTVQSDHAEGRDHAADAAAAVLSGPVI